MSFHRDHWNPILIFNVKFQKLRILRSGMDTWRSESIFSIHCGRRHCINACRILLQTLLANFLWVIYDIRLQHSQNPASLLLLSTSVRISISIHQGLFSNGNLLPDCTHVMFAETASLPAFPSFLWSCRQPRSYKLYLLLAGSKLPALEN
jgi:hypothetical protein